MYKGIANWDLIREVKQKSNIHIPIFGNGDIDSPQKALQYRQQFGVDGIMIGRAAIGNPWIFNQIKHYFKTGETLPSPSIEQRVEAVREHLEKSIEWKGTVEGIFEMRPHYSNYFKGLNNFKEFRMQLVTKNDPDQLYRILDSIAEHYSTALLDQ
jgi:tRNA-dihydrouridine synthase